MMAKIYDRWHKSFPKPDEPRCAEHGKAPTAEHGIGGRWQVRWHDGGWGRKANFVKRSDAEWHLAHLFGNWCLVKHCGKSAVTEPPVLLCADHRDMIIQQVTRKRPRVHEPVVYFIRNGERVKIGWTTNLRQRLSMLSLPASAVSLVILGGPAEEKALHIRFAKARIGRTEWFDSCEAIEDYIMQQQPRPETYAGKLFAQIRGEREQAA
jgi:hypothetical protein